MVAMDSTNGSQNLAPSWYAMSRSNNDIPAKHAREEGFALKGRRIPAQGNALGLVWPPSCVLKERRNRGDRAHACHSKIGGVPSERVHMSACFPERCSGLVCNVPLGQRQSGWRSPPETRAIFAQKHGGNLRCYSPANNGLFSTTSPRKACLRCH
jgi:hypothetical protein